MDGQMERIGEMLELAADACVTTQNVVERLGAQQVQLAQVLQQAITSRPHQFSMVSPEEQVLNGTMEGSSS